MSAQILGSSETQQFIQLVADRAWYRTLSRQTVLSFRLRAGAMWAPLTTFSDVNKPTNYIPPANRFYAGGPNDVRGYQLNGLGPINYLIDNDSVPVDTTDLLNMPIPPGAVRYSPIGGNLLGVGNVELRLPSPVWGRLFRWVAFVDAGVLWDRYQNTPEIRVTPGIGLRLVTPLGPVRLDVGYNGYSQQPGRAVPEPERRGVQDPGDVPAERQPRPVRVSLRRGTTVLMRRRLAHVVFVTGFGTVALVVGLLAALTVAPPGRRLLARTVTTFSDRVFRGHLTIGDMSGNFLTNLSLRRRGADGQQRRGGGGVSRGSTSATTCPTCWRAGSISPRCAPSRRSSTWSGASNGRMNYEEVLHLGEGTGSAVGRPSSRSTTSRSTAGRSRSGSRGNPRRGSRPAGATPRWRRSARFPAGSSCRGWRDWNWSGASTAWTWGSSGSRSARRTGTRSRWSSTRWACG